MVEATKFKFPNYDTLFLVNTRQKKTNDFILHNFIGNSTPNLLKTFKF